MILEWNKSCIELIALYVHPKNSLRSHSRAIMALGHSRKQNSWKTNQAELFAFDKFTLQNLAHKSGWCKSTFYTFYTSEFSFTKTNEYLNVSKNPESLSLKIKFMFWAAGFPVFAVFKDELATRKSLKAFFLQPKLWLNILRNVFLSIRGEISTKGFLKFCELISNLILGQISISNLNTNVHKLAS